MRKYLTFCVLAPLAIACATPGKRTAVGAGGGAAVGAGVGAIAGGWKGAVIGAAVGGLAGGAVGNYLDKQAEELKQVAENTKRTKDGILIDLKSKLLFTTDSAVLKPEAVELVAKLGDILAKYPEDRIRVTGRSRATARRRAGRRTGASSCTSTCRRRWRHSRPVFRSTDKHAEHAKISFFGSLCGLGVPCG
jgi:outer membrane lipoprotein SlyB